MRKWLMRAQLLIANGVHPVSDGTGRTLLLLGTKIKKIGVEKKKLVCYSGPVLHRALWWCGQVSNLSMGNCKIFGAVLFFLAIGQKLLKC